MSHRYSALLALVLTTSSSCTLVVNLLEADDEVPVAACDDWPARAAIDFELCEEEEVPAESLQIFGERWTYDSDSGVLVDRNGVTSTPFSKIITMPNGLDARIIMANGVTLDADLRLRGTLPVVIASWTSIEVGEDIDVNGGGNGSSNVVAAGANPETCGDIGGESGLELDGIGGGGGGGSYDSPGGAGGLGALDDPQDALVAEGGSAGRLDEREGLQGGCPGGDGGGEPVGGTGGDGGGALALVAMERIALFGDIQAGGRGGRGGDAPTGAGGGGGSGGMVWLAAPDVFVASSARISVAGGGGGGGASANDDGRNGAVGGEDGLPADGGDGAEFAGSGGIGSSIQQDQGFAGEDAFFGGGGGGGGSGRIAIDSQGLTLNPGALLIPGLGEPR